MEVLINIIVAMCAITIPVTILWGSLNIYELVTGREI